MNKTDRAKLQTFQKTVERLREEADEHSNKAAAGYDEGWYNGEENAYSEVLTLLKQVIE